MVKLVYCICRKQGLSRDEFPATGPRSTGPWRPAEASTERRRDSSGPCLCFRPSSCARRRPPVKTVADPRVVDGLVRRLERLTPATPRRWGTLSAHEMLCHLADASSSVLARPAGEVPRASRAQAAGPLHVDPLASRPADTAACRPADRWNSARRLRARSRACHRGTACLGVGSAERLSDHPRTLRRHDPERLAAVGISAHGPPPAAVRPLACCRWSCVAGSRTGSMSSGWRMASSGTPSPRHG